MATLFLMLVSETTMTVNGSDDALRVILSRILQWWDLLSLKWWSALWNEKWLGNTSISLFPKWNVSFKESNNGNTLLRQLLVSTIELLMLFHYLAVIWSREKQWYCDFGENLFSSNVFKVWL